MTLTNETAQLALQKYERTHLNPEFYVYMYEYTSPRIPDTEVTNIGAYSIQCYILIHIQYGY